MLGVGGGAAVGVAAQVVHPLRQLGGEERAERDALGLVVLADGLEHPLVHLLTQVVGVGQVQPDRAHVALQTLEADRAVVPAQVVQEIGRQIARGAPTDVGLGPQADRRRAMTGSPGADPLGEDGRRTARAIDAVEAVALVVADRDAVGQVGPELVEGQLVVDPEVDAVPGRDGRERPAVGLGEAAEDERLAGTGAVGGGG